MKTEVRRWTAIAMLQAVLLCVPGLGAQELKNASFEEPGGDGELWISDRAAHWERWGGWFNRETSWSPVLDGQCLAAYHHWRIQGDDPSGLYQDIPDVAAGEPYTFKIKVFKDKLTNADYVELRLEPYLGGATLASTVYRMTELKSGRWNVLSVTGVCQRVGIRVLVIAKPGRSPRRKGALKFDNAELAPAPPAAEVDEGQAMPAQQYFRRR